MASLDTPVSYSAEAKAKGDGYTEFAKLLVSVVMPVIRARALNPGNLCTSPPIEGSDRRT